MVKRQNVDLFDKLGMQKKKSNMLRNRLKSNNTSLEKSQRADKKSIDDLMSRLNKASKRGR